MAIPDIAVGDAPSAAEVTRAPRRFIRAVLGNPLPQLLRAYRPIFPAIRSDDSIHLDVFNLLLSGPTPVRFPRLNVDLNLFAFRRW